MKTVRDLFLVALLSTTLVGLELIWTRLFSAEFYYTFAFLVLSLAVLGLGLGALATRLLPFLRRDKDLGPVLALTLAAGLAGPPLVFRLGLKFSELFQSWAMVGRFVLTIGLLSAAFFFGGMALAILFRRHHGQMHRVYMADLLGAGAGVVVAVDLMNRLGTPAATFAISIPVLVAALWGSRTWRKAIPALLAVPLAILCLNAGPLLEVERQERAPVIYKHWDAMSKIKVYGYGKEHRSINIDNIANTGVYGFDGDWDRPEKFEFGIDVSYLIEQFDGATFLSLGAGGGSDVLQALQAGASEVHAVEVNAHINRMLVVGDLSGYIIPPPPPPAPPEPPAEETAEAEESEEPPADESTEADAEPEESSPEEIEPPAPPEEIMTLAEFSGNIYRDPRVIVVTEDARAYVSRFKDEFDLIYSLSSNTFAAVASGSFALAEDYLFTTEAFEDYWEALSPGGFMMMEHQFYMPRLVGSLIDALERLGVEDPRSHFAVYDLPKMRRNMILLSRRPLTDEIRLLAFGELTPEKFEDIHLLYPAPEGLEDNQINQIVLEGWESAAGAASVDISPTTDDRPFVGQMGLWKNLTWENLENLWILEVNGFPLAKSMIVTILVIITVLLVPLNLVPYLMKGDKLRAVPWLYFFTIGAAFMAVEVVLIQQYTRFVGPSAYSIATILLTLLLASGIGSRFSRAVGDRLAFFGIVGWLLLDVLVFRHLLYALGGLPMGARMAVTLLLVAPLGFFMGMPFPKAASRVGKLIDWGFAVNGTASVLGATGILLVAFTSGLGAALLTGGALYLLAFGLLSMKARWSPRLQ